MSNTVVIDSIDSRRCTRGTTTSPFQALQLPASPARHLVRMLTTILCALFVLLAWSLPAAAHPSTSDPDAPLVVRSDEISRAQAAAGYALAKSIRQSLDELLAKRANGALASGDLLKVGDIYSSIATLGRIATTLTARGEAAGADLQQRRLAMTTQTRLLAKEIMKAPGFPMQTIRAAADRTLAECERQIPGIKQMISAGQVEQASTQLEIILSKLQAATLWFEGTSDGPAKYLSPFVGLRNETDELLQQHAIGLLAKQLTDQLAAERPVIADRLAKIEQLPALVKSAGHAEIAGVGGDGPPLLVALADEQAAIQVLLTRAIAKANLLTIAQSEGAKIGAELEAQQKVLGEKTNAAMKELCVVMVERTDAADGAKFYDDLMAAAGKLGRHYSIEEIDAIIAPALPPLLAKSTGLEAEIQSYQARTDELLRWRHRVAEARGKYLSSGRDKRVSGVLLENALAQGAKAGLYATANPGPKSMQICSPASDILARLRADVVGKPCTVFDVVGSGAPSGRVVGTLDDRVYTRMAIFGSTKLDLQVSQLTKELAAESSVPRTVRASVALQTAKDRCFSRVGGPIEECTLESLLPRMAGLSEGAASMFRVGPLVEPISGDLAGHVLVRVDVAPQWVQHLHFYTELDVPAPPATPAGVPAPGTPATPPSAIDENELKAG